MQVVNAVANTLFREEFLTSVSFILFQLVQNMAVRGAGNAQEESMVPNRPIRVAEACISMTCSYISKIVHVGL